MPLTMDSILIPRFLRHPLYGLFLLIGFMTLPPVHAATKRIDVISTHVVRPAGVAVTPTGDVWITNQGDCYQLGLSGCTTNASVILVSAQGTKIYTGFASPAGIAVDSKGNAWVANLGGNNVQHINASTNSVDIVLSDPNLQLINTPTSVAVDSEDNVLIANRATQVISKYSSTGKFLSYLKVSMNLFSLAIGPDDRLWIADTQDNAIYCPSLGISFKLPKNTAPHALAIDALGRPWVANYNTASVVQFSQKGRPLNVVKSGVRFPTGVDFDAEGYLYISNFSNNNVGKYLIK
jgi:streptogramin lyase